MVEDERAQDAAAALAASQERLRVAEVLFQTEYFRDAISRAYYAVLDGATACLAARGIQTQSHAGAIRKFSQEFIRTGSVPRQYGRWFARLETARINADYDLRKPASGEEAEAVLGMAREFVAMVEKLLLDLLNEEKT